jgi:NAD(P)-dependent dehydrogenase (short-subunit alcohol dehydrogenase family)
MGLMQVGEIVMLMVITGASAGIGLATAQRFVDDGYDVVNLSRRRCPIRAVTHVNCDLAVPGFFEPLSSQLTPMLKDAERIVLIHNAARLSNDSAVETPSNKLREVLERATCQDLAGRSIHTACICPGFTDTEMLRAHVPSDAMEGVRAMSAYGRLIAPEEIAQTLHWAASNPVINGAVIHANLGQIER